MASSRIKGITVEIGGDTTKLQTALKGVNSSIKDTQSQLKDVEKKNPAALSMFLCFMNAETRSARHKHPRRDR